MSTLVEDSAGRRFEDLDEDECFSLIHQGRYGRIATLVGIVAVVFPVNYYAEERHIYFFTGPGTQLAAAADKPVATFEIDHFDTPYHEGWSVLAVGKAVVLDENTARELGPIPVAPWAPGERGMLIGIAPDFVSGRRIRASG